MPVFGAQLAPHEISARLRSMPFTGSQVGPRKRVKDYKRAERIESRGFIRASHDLGGIFIDRLYSSGDDLRDDGVSEGARMIAQSGDDQD